MNTSWSVVLVQLGCRRAYATAAALALASKLEMLYTDFYAGKIIAGLRFTNSLGKLFGPCVKRICARSSPHIPLDKVSHFPSFALQYKLRKLLAARRGELPKAYIWGGRTFCEIVSQKLSEKCRVVYCFSSVAKEVFQGVAGFKTVRILDQATPPLYLEEELVRKAGSRYADWVKTRAFSHGSEEYSARQAEEWKLADVIICASKFCADTILASGVEESKVRVVPFGIAPRYYEAGSADRVKRQREGLRVLFVGNDPLRKGMIDVVIALEQLQSWRIRGMFVGSMESLTLYGLNRMSRVGTIVGSVPMTEMLRIYREADVLALPSVSDSFGAVVLEALAAGLPVITTQNCGASEAIRDGIEGFIVPVGCPEAIAERLKLLARDPDLLAEMGRRAAQRAREYTLECYQERLMRCLRASIEK